MDKDCLYFQYADRREGEGANCWRVPTSYGKSCLQDVSGKQENKFVGSDLHFCQVESKKNSVWLSILADSFTESGGCKDITVNVGLGDTIGTNTLITETIAGDLGPGSFDQAYQGQVYASHPGENIILSPICFSSSLEPQPHALFDVETSNGGVVLKATSGGANSASLDYETKQEYGILVTVTDATSQSQTPSLAYRRITVTDVNEPPIWNYACPEDASVIACFQIPEGTAVGTSVTQKHGGTSPTDTSTISASDVDSGDTLTYTIVGGNTLVDSTLSAFSIASATGIGSNVAIELQVNAAGLDTEASANPWYDLLIQVSDSSSLTPQNAGIVRVYLIDVNEIPTLSEETFSMNEAVDASLTEWTIGTILGTDSDPTPLFNSLTYEILTMPINDLSLGGNAVASTTATGTLAKNVLIDDVSKVWKPAATGETEVTLEIDLRADSLTVDRICLQLASTSEYSIPNRLELSTKVAWTDASWSSQRIYPNGNLCEEGESTTLLCYTAETEVRFIQYKFTGSCDPSLTTIHPDLAVSRIHVYGIDLFSLSYYGGILSLSENALNFETYAEYNLVVRVMDGGGLYADNNVIVQIQDVNEAPFVGIQRLTCVQGCDDTTRAVAEGSVETFQIGLPIPADDLDNVLRDVQALTYSMEVLDGSQVFSIHGCTGQLEVLLPNALNYESKSSYSVRVTVTDDGNPLQFDTSLITVAIVDVNEYPVIQDQQRSVNEIELNLDGTWKSGSNVPACQQVNQQTWPTVLQNIPTTAGSFIESFDMPEYGGSFIAVANFGTFQTNYGANSEIYKWNIATQQFVHFQDIPTQGGFSISFLSIPQEAETPPLYFLGVANNCNNACATADREVDSKIYKFNPSTSIFDEFFSISTHAGIDVESFAIGSKSFFAFTNYNQGSTYAINSVVYVWDQETTQFELFQSIPTIGAVDFEYFEIDGNSYLAVANQFDGTQYNVQSQIMMFSTVNKQFENIQAVNTWRGQQIEQFNIGDRHFLGVTDTYDGDHIAPTHIYEWKNGAFQGTESGRQNEAFQIFSTRQASTLEHFYVDNKHFLAIGEAGSISDQTEQGTGDSTIYLWDGATFVPYTTMITHGVMHFKAFSVASNSGVVGGTRMLFSVAHYKEDVTSSTPFALNAEIYSLIDSCVNGDVVGVPLSANDPDNAALNNANKQSLTFSIASGVGSQYFVMDGTTGQVRVAQIPTIAESNELNFEATNLYTLTVNVEDDGVIASGTTTTLVTTAILIINILDIPETPIAPNYILPTSVLESASIGTDVGVYDVAYDPDNLKTSGTDPLTYAYSTNPVNTDHAYFNINLNTGMITTAQLLDFETKQSYLLNIRVTDSTGLYDEAVVTVNIEDVSEGPSVSPEQNAYFVENSPISTTATSTSTNSASFILGVVDQDDTTFTYSLISTVPSTDMFGMATNGAMTLVKAQLNYEARTQYIVTVRATDASGAFDDGDVTVHISNANDAPYYTATDASYAYVLAENSPTNTLVNAAGTVCVKDEDIDSDGTPSNSHTFSVKSQTPSNVIDGIVAIAYVGCVASLRMKVTTTSPLIDLNFETPGGARFDITVTVTDNGTPAMSEDAGIVITLSNQNDPPILDDITFSIGETAQAGATIDTIVATDEDLGQPTEVLSYAITSGNVCGTNNVQIFIGTTSLNRMVLTIADWTAGLGENACNGNSCNGYIQECALPTGGNLMDPGDSFSLGVRVTDAFMGVQAIDTATITVRLTEANNPPDFGNMCVGGNAAKNIAEDAVLNQNVGSVTATDLDGPSPMTYSIISGNIGTQFSVTNAGLLVVSGLPNTLDYENVQLRSYVLELRASDGLGASTSCTVTVSVTDVNEAPSISATTRSIEEDAVIGANVGLPVIGSDPENDILTYTISDPSSTFAVSVDTGQIQVNAALDKELVGSYTVTLTTSDSAGLTSTATITILIIDVNDPPVLEDLSFSVSEFLSSGSTIRTLPGTDEDVTDDTDARPLHYAMVASLSASSVAEGLADLATAQSMFEVTPNQDAPGTRPRLSSLSLKTGVSLNYEVDAYYLFGIQVSDADGATATSTVRISITNENETPTWECVEGSSTNCPFSPTVKYNAKLPENSVEGTMLRDIPSKVSDPDGIWTHVINAGCANVITSETYNQDDRISGSIVPSCWKGYDDESIREMMYNGELKLVFNEGETDAMTIYIQLVDYPSGTLRTFSSDPTSNTAARWRMSQDTRWHGPCSSSSQLANGNWFFFKTEKSDSYTCETSNNENTLDISTGFTNRDSATFFPFTGFPDTSASDSFKSAKIYARTKWGTSQYSITASSPTVNMFTVARESWPKNEVEYETLRLSVLTNGLDYEANVASSGSTDVFYALTVRATDEGDASSDITFQINVVDVNEPPSFPLSSSDRILTIDENSASNILVGNLIATDPDDATDHTGMLHYDITGGTGMDKFRLSITADSLGTARNRYVDASPSVFTSLANLDFEKVNSYSLSVRTYDGMRSCQTVGVTQNTISGANEDVRQVDAIDSNGDGRCVYWEVEIDPTSTTGSAPWIGITTVSPTSSATIPAATGGSDWNHYSFYVRMDPDDTVKQRNLKKWGTIDVDLSIADVALLSPVDPKDAKLCTNWEELSTGTTLPSNNLNGESAPKKSLNDMYKLTSSTSVTSALFIYDPDPRWTTGGGQYWQSNTVRSDGTSDVKCAAGAAGTWSAPLPSSSPALTSSCLIKKGVVGSSNCDVGNVGASANWFLYDNGQTTDTSGASGPHPCFVSGVTFDKLEYCTGTVDPTITTLPRKSYGLVIDYDPDLKLAGPIYPPLFRIYHDNKLWIENIPIGVTTNAELGPNAGYYPAMKTDSTGVTAWRSATKRSDVTQLMYTPRSESRIDRSLSTIASYTVRINNVNEKPSLVNTNRYVNENSPTDTVLTGIDGTDGALVAIDDDLKVCPGPSPDIITGCTANACTSSCQKLTYTRTAHMPCFQGTLNSLTDPCLNIIDVDSCTGNMLVSNPLPGTNPIGLDYETRNTYTITVKVIDDGTYPGPQQDEAIVTVYVVDINEVPVVLNTILTVGETSTSGTSFGFVSAADPDDTTASHGTLSFSVATAGNALGLFTTEKSFYGSVDTSGVCSLTGSTNCWCRLRCPVLGYTTRDLIDGKTCKNPATSAECYLGYCDGSATPSGMPTCPFATGWSGGTTGSYGSGGANMKLASAATGQLDYETTSRYDLTVIATDGGFGTGATATLPLSSSGTVVVHILDVNEPPVLADALGGTYTVAEDKDIGFAIGNKLLATDPDVGQIISYTITSSTPSSGTSVFIVESDGQLKVNGALDFETIPVYTLTIRATDNGVPSLNSITDATVVITLLDINESPELNDQSFNVDENSERDVLVGTLLTFTEPDEGQVHSFNIISGNSANMFDISAGTGQITVNQDGSGGVNGLDFETTPTYSLTIEITDSGVPPLSNTATVAITLINQNDSPSLSTYLPRLDLSIGENSAIGNSAWTTGASTTTTYCATDQDVSDQLIFSIISGNDAGTFDVVASAIDSRCFIVVMDSNTPSDLNYEDPLKNMFDLVIQATDNGVGYLSTTLPVRVTIENRNDPPTLSSVSLSVPENAKANDPVGASIVAVDEDTGDTLTYTIDAGLSNTCDTFYPVFDINSVNSIGFLSMHSTFNPEPATTPNRPGAELQSCSTPAPTSFTVTVRVSDGAGGEASATYTITVAEQNDPPTFTDCATERSLTLSENSNDGTLVGPVLLATDPDLGDTVSWRLLAQGNPGSAFGIVVSTGQLKVVTGSLINFEGASNPYLLTVEALDDEARTSGGATTRCSVRVTLIDVNEPPVLDNSYSRSVEERSLPGVTVGLPIVATDPDAGVAGTLSFSLPATITFDIDENGQIKINCPVLDLSCAEPVLDYEIKSIYAVQVRVTDNGNPDPLSSTSIVTISVLDINDPPAMPTMTVSMDEDANPGAVVPSSALLGTDEDSTDNTVSNPLTYVMEAHSGATGPSDLILAQSKFNIFLSSGSSPVLQLKSTLVNGLNYETQNTYSFNLKVSDDNVPMPFSSSALCVINIININEAPIFTTTCLADSTHAYCFDVLENVNAGDFVGTVVASDPDVGQIQSYAITSSSPTASAFDITTSTGQIVVMSGISRDLLDHETAGIYVLTIVATDDGVLQTGDGAVTLSTPKSTVAASVQITIVDINEPPTFPPAPSAYPNRPSTFPEVRWLTVDENTGNDIVLGGSVQATDPDDSTTNWGKLTYEITTDSSPFEMVCDNDECKSTTSSVQLKTSSTGSGALIGLSGWGNSMEHKAWHGSSLASYTTEAAARTACENPDTTPNCKGISLKVAAGGKSGGYLIGKYYKFKDFASPMNWVASAVYWECKRWVTPGLQCKEMILAKCPTFCSAES